MLRNMFKQKGSIIILSAPSGTGKTTISNIILKKDTKIKRSISVTTRKKRLIEKNGIDYFFITDSDFQKLVKKNEFFEYAKVFDNYYGTRKKDIEDLLNEGIDVFCCIDWQGFLQIKKYNECYNIVSIFLLPSSFSILKKRLEERECSDFKKNQIRLDTAREEVGYCNQYDYVIVNDDLNETVENVHSIIKLNRIIIHKQSLKTNIKQFFENKEYK